MKEFREYLSVFGILSTVGGLLFLFTLTPTALLCKYDIGNSHFKDAEGPVEHVEEFTQMYVNSLTGGDNVHKNFGYKAPVWSEVLMAALVLLSWPVLAFLTLIAACAALLLPDFVKCTWGLPQDIRVTKRQNLALENYLSRAYSGEDPGHLHLIEALRGHSDKPDQVLLEHLDGTANHSWGRKHETRIAMIRLKDNLESRTNGPNKHLEHRITIEKLNAIRV